MASFYEELQEDRPDRIQDLWPTSGAYWRRHDEKAKKVQDGSRRKHPECVLAEFMDVWASQEEIFELIQDENSLKQLVEVVFIHYSRSLMDMLQLFGSENESFHKRKTLMACEGCNRTFDQDRFRWEGSEESEILDLTDRGNIGVLSHILLTVLRVFNQLILLQPDHCNTLVFLLTTSETVQQGNLGHLHVLDYLLQVCYCCANNVPTIGYAANTLLSLLVARRPAHIFAFLFNQDIDFLESSDTPNSVLSNCLADYIQERVLVEFRGEFEFQREFAAVAFVRMSPLLYLLGHCCPVLEPSLGEKFLLQLTQVVEEFLPHCDTTGSGCSDSNARQDLLNPFLPNLRHLKGLIGSEGAAVLAALEILMYWLQFDLKAEKAVPALKKCKDQLDSLVSEVGTCHGTSIDFAVFPVLLSQFCTEAVNPPSKERRQRVKELLDGHSGSLLLTKPLKEVRRKCGQCGAKYAASDEEPLLGCGGGCQGLELYCCREHQKSHWKTHKVLCKKLGGKPAN